MLEQLLENNPDKLKIVFKHFPLRSHKQANEAAQAAIAAQHQGKFWIYHDELFVNRLQLDQPGIFLEIAEKIKLDMDKFSKDMMSQETKKQVARDYQDGVKAGITGIPAVFINGRLLKKRTVSEAQKMIDEEYKKNGR